MPAPRPIQAYATPRVTKVINVPASRIARLACSSVLCALIVTACASESGDRSGSNGTGGANRADAGTTGGADTTGGAGGASGGSTLTDAGREYSPIIVYDTSCPRVQTVISSCFCNGLCGSIPVTESGCCLPSGLCGFAIDAVCGIGPDLGCYSYAATNWPPPQDVACTYPRQDGGLDATTADSSGDSSAPRESSDSAADGPG